MACPPRFYSGEPGILYRNNGSSGTFTDVTRRAGALARDGKSLGCLFADVDDDGRLDLFVANDGVANNLFRNETPDTQRLTPDRTSGFRQASGVFPAQRAIDHCPLDARGPRQAPLFRDEGLLSGTAYNANGDAEASMGVDAGDFDGDGRLDLVATAFQEETDAIYRNEGDGQFAYVTAEVGLAEATRPCLSFGCGWIDADNDGDLDLFVVSGHVQDTIARADPACTFAQPRHLFRNEGGRFHAVGTASPALARAAVGRGAAFGDVDNDGDLDILVNNNGGPPLLLLNAEGSRRSWLRVRLQGRAPNRFGVGARVRVVAGGRAQVAEAHAGHSYASSSDPRLHFGLGAARTVERVEVRWPRGATSVLTSLPANQEITLTEPERGRP
jgi:hypothetical protein